VSKQLRSASVVLASVAAAAAIGVPAASAGSTTLPVQLQLVLNSRLSACAANTTCSAIVRRLVVACRADASCSVRLDQFLADNPTIAAVLARITGEVAPV
jgi:hypothetical protein